MMRRHLIWLAACLVLVTPASAATAQEAVQARFMGDMTCGGWREAPGTVDGIQKAALVNWVLGFLVGRSAIRGDDLLSTNGISGIAAWLDDYCSRNPLNSLITAAYDLEKALIARRAM
ncbi:hypothetical protein D3C72_275570 [compost metagenome]